MASTDLDNVVIEHLRHIRGKVDRIGDDVVEVKQRLTNLEIGQGQLQTQMGQLNGRIDRIELRIDRIEQRLDLSDDNKPAAE